MALAPINNPDLVAATIAQTLGVKESGNQPIVDNLKNFLHFRQMLLILDNFEQVVSAALLVAELLRNTGKFTMADVLSFRLKQRPVRLAAATSTMTVSLFYLLAQMAGAGIRRADTFDRAGCALAAGADDSANPWLFYVGVKDA